VHYRYTLAALAALSAIAASHPAAAGTQIGSPDTRSTRVSYADLNLQSEAGARTMFQRIRHAARSVCEINLDDSWDGRVRYFACVRDTTDQAIAKLDSPLVTAMNSSGPPKSQIVLAETRP
jgi:UrcA family protein